MLHEVRRGTVVVDIDLSTGALLAQVQGARRNDERAEERLIRLLVP